MRRVNCPANGPAGYAKQQFEKARDFQKQLLGVLEATLDVISKCVAAQEVGDEAQAYVIAATEIEPVLILLHETLNEINDWLSDAQLHLAMDRGVTFTDRNDEVWKSAVVLDLLEMDFQMKAAVVYGVTIESTFDEVKSMIALIESEPWLEHSEMNRGIAWLNSISNQYKEEQTRKRK
mmetsp:Transcript_999/g.2178  ORF Transcript_999/g.2178 Transcript_999/m.2178 type:complete len:178 (-) Transcript_999:14-547(-)|eukprot:CAMPEP_0194755240 /NCGR_PEP_ID=MMETSP0323_2-20130528/9136_1 /TAXON_ID=2866 ORGANISM="Crypthecodinium cohnii, Strain Seligo" /NCGR_SAMPLE_ID=MMETSP0323_2 /ASSEMBLY_ACC=CAM_ASM_000346 /LENGTH=177 /DNA_ID=CAMNT_0039674203 /DNA_START=128 /DNA_END=661 /DNA_ORIENTATION=+